MGMAQWAVLAIDMGCDCCAYVPVKSFGNKDLAKAWIARQDNPRNYELERVKS